MSRHTHSSSRPKHPRSHTRHQRDRYIDRRWRRLKNYEHYHWDRATGFIHPEEVAQARLPRRSIWEVARRGRSNLLNRNPWNLCSCWSCQKSDEPRRARERVAARREIADGYAEWEANV